LEEGAVVDGAVDGVGVVGVDGPPEPSGPLPSLLAQLPLWPCRVDGAVEPPVDGAVEPPLEGWLLALGAAEADGSGLAAATTATPPTVNRPAARASVATVRRMPLKPRDAVSTVAGWSFHSMEFSLLRNGG
jgi:hypothetical protein